VILSRAGAESDVRLHELELAFFMRTGTVSRWIRSDDAIGGTSEPVGLALT
jgi:hypothetical protein